MSSTEIAKMEGKEIAPIRDKFLNVLSKDITDLQELIIGQKIYDLKRLQTYNETIKAIILTKKHIRNSGN